MTKTSFTVALLKPEIASGTYAFAAADVIESAAQRSVTSRTDDAVHDVQEAGESEPSLRSSIPGVSARDAALLYPNGQILAHLFARIARAGFCIREQRAVAITKPQARALFSHERERLRDESKFSAYLDSLTRGLSLALLLELPGSLSANDAVARWKELVGTLNPVAARQDVLSASVPQDEWPLHALCGLNAIENGIQSSVSLDCAVRERALLFPEAAPALERAVVVVLPTFQAACPDGKASLLAKLHARGVLVMRVLENHQVASANDLALLAKELHPVTTEQHRSEFLNALQDAASYGSSCILELEARGLATTLCDVLGPASVDDARHYFPDSVRAQLSTSLLPLLAHVRTRDDAATGLESGVFVSFDPRTIDALVQTSSHAIEHTLALLKPGTASDLSAVAAIEHAIRAAGFTIEAQRRVRLTRAQAATFYGEHRGKAFFERLLAFMTSGELVAMRLARPSAIAAWRALMGPTNALQARETHPQSLRARFGVDGTRNATHGSDAPGSAQRELQFFFGGGLVAFERERALGNVTTKAVAQRALAAPYAPSDTPEKVLTQALDEMLELDTLTQLDACTWLGTWLLEYAQRQQQQHEQQDATHATCPSSPSKRATRPAPPRKPRSTTVTRAGGNDPLACEDRTIVAIAFAPDVAAPVRAAVNEALLSLAAPAYLVIDAAAVVSKHAQDMNAAVATLTQQIASAGKRRVVLQGFDVYSTALVKRFTRDWRITSAVTIRNWSSDSDKTEPFTPATALDPLVPHMHYQLPEHTLDATSDATFTSFFAGLLCPSVVVAHDTKTLVDIAHWCAVASHLGVTLLALDDLVRARISREHDPNGVFTQLQRTGAAIPRELLLSLVRDVVQHFEPKCASDDASLGVAQRFLLVGFPLATVRPSELEQHVCAITHVLHVSTESTRPVHDGENDAWLEHAAARGILTPLCIDAHTSPLDVRASCALSFGPIVGFYLDDASSTPDKLPGHVERLASAHGFAVIRVYELVRQCGHQVDALVGHFERILLPKSGGFASGRAKVLVCGVSSTSSDVLRAVIECVVVPRFVVFADVAGIASDVLAVLDAHPQIVQLDLAPASYAPPHASDIAPLQSVLFGKRVAFAVGDTAALDATRLRQTLAHIGVSVLDSRKTQQQQAQERPLSMDVSDLLARIQATASPRCLVIGYPEHVAFVCHDATCSLLLCNHIANSLLYARVSLSLQFQALERVGGRAAADKILVLKHIERQAPPTRAAKRDDDEDYYSDDEAELERERKLRARTALPPHLDELLQSYSTTAGKSPSTSADARTARLNFVSVDAVYELIRRQLAPVLLSVVGHPHTFYDRALQACARRHAIAMLRPRWWRELDDHAAATNSSGSQSRLDQQLAALRRFVATTPFGAYVLDGFPRTHDSNAAPYVAQQLISLEHAVAPLRGLVHFTASMDVLLERKPERVTRNAIEDAQDALEAATQDLLTRFGANATSKRTGASVWSVTCERELQDAEEELDQVVLRLGI